MGLSGSCCYLCDLFSKTGAIISPHSQSLSLDSRPKIALWASWVLSQNRGFSLTITNESDRGNIVTSIPLTKKWVKDKDQKRSVEEKEARRCSSET